MLCEEKQAHLEKLRLNVFYGHLLFNHLVFPKSVPSHKYKKESYSNERRNQFYQDQLYRNAYLNNRIRGLATIRPRRLNLISASYENPILSIYLASSRNIFSILDSYWLLDKKKKERYLSTIGNLYVLVNSILLLHFKKPYFICC